MPDNSESSRLRGDQGDDMRRETRVAVNRRQGMPRVKQELGISTPPSPIAPPYGLNTEKKGRQCLEKYES